MNRTPTEQVHLDAIHKRVSLLRSFLNARPIPSASDPASEWLIFLAEMKAIVGNASNDVSFVACLLAKEYMCQHFEMQQPFDVALKPQSAPGYDIDAQTIHGERIIGEIKTTTPYLPTDFGAQQLQGFKKDIAKLGQAPADVRFFFVTDPHAYAVVRQRYLPLLSDGGIEAVLLPSPDQSTV